MAEDTPVSPDWERLISEREQCYFPLLNDGAVFVHNAGRKPINFGPVEDVQKFCRLNHMSFSSVLQASWGIVLRCYTRKDHVAFGYRAQPAGDIQTVAAATIAAYDINISGSARIDEVLNDFQSHQEPEICSLADVEQVWINEGPGWFNTMLAVNWDYEDSACDIIIDVKISDHSLQSFVHYKTSRLSDGQAINLASTLESAWNAVLERPSEAVDEQSLFTTFHSTQLESWNETGPVMVNECIHHLFSDQASLNPGKIAIEAWDGTLTYQELDRLSSILASYLIGLGIGPESFIPVLFPKTAMVPVAWMAVLKAGAAFVPLDASHPTSRLKEILDTTDAKILLSSSMYAGILAESVEKVIVLDKSLLSQLPNSYATSTTVTPSNAAFAIFTSGSTGRPKGIVVEHSNFSSGAKRMWDVTNMHSGSRALQFASYSFSSCLYEILMTLSHGACLCIPTDEDRMDNLLGCFNDMAITWALLTPSVLKPLDPKSIQHLQTLLLLGEAMSKDDVPKWAARTNLVYSYASSENSLVSFNTRLEELSDSRNVGHGGGICWIADINNHEKLAPLGAVGELITHGPMVARCYLKEPEKNAATFIEAPSWLKRIKPGYVGRVLKTGDLMHFNSDGSMSTAGRKDMMVKLRGQRVEMGEIERVLTADPAVKQALVSMPLSGPLKQTIVATVRLHHLPGNGSGNQFHIKELELLGDSDLKTASAWIPAVSKDVLQRLPRYMLPTAWLIVKAIPLTFSGKLDRMNVLNWIHNMPQNLADHIMAFGAAPETKERITEMEARLQDIWSGVLNIPNDRIGRNRSFMSMGGDSVMAMGVVAACRSHNITLSINEKDVAVTVKDVLTSSSLSQFAQNMQLGTPKNTTLHVEEFDIPFELSSTQKMYVEMHGFDEEMNHLNQNFKLLLSDKINITEVPSILEFVIKRHSMLRARFVCDEAGWRQIIPREPRYPYRFLQHSCTCEAEVELIVSNSQESLDIETGPVFSIDLVTVQKAGHRTQNFLYFVGHYLVIDLISWRTIIGEIDSLLSGGSLPIKKSLSFQAWTRLQASYTSGLVTNKVMPFKIPRVPYEYWSMTSAYDYPQDTINDTFTLPKDITLKLIQQDPLDSILGALFYSFSQNFQDRSIPAIFVEGHGRESWQEDADISGTVGNFTTVSPVHLDKVSGIDILNLIRRVKHNRQTLPLNGSLYHAMRYLNQDGKETFAHQSPEIFLSYQGQFQRLEWADSLLKATPHTFQGGNCFNAQRPRPALFEVSVIVNNDKMEVKFSYSKKSSQLEHIKSWIQDFGSVMVKLAEQIQNMKPQATLADFPLMNIGFEDMEHLFDENLQGIGLTIHDVEDIYPCSPMQDGILISQGLRPNQYRCRFIWLVTSRVDKLDIDIRRLVHAWQEVVSRHQCLRTIFLEGATTGGFSNQVVLKDASASLSVMELGHEDAVTLLGSREYSIFDKARPPHHLTVCNTPLGETYMMLEINHALIDGESINIILHELSNAYRKRLSAVPAPSYSKYISYLQGKTHEEDLKYWTSALGNLDPCHFPKLLGVSSTTTSRLQNIPIDLPISAQKIHQFCSERNTTVSSLFRIAWALVLRSYVGADQVCFGYLTSGRDLPISGIQEVVGPLINMLICRIDLTGEKSVGKLLEEVQADFLESLNHQTCSLAEIQHLLKLPGKALFNTSMSLLRSIDLGNETEDSLHFEPKSMYDPDEFDISINITVSSSIIKVDLKYWNYHSSDQSAVFISDAFCQALQSLIGSSSQIAKSIPLLGAASKKLILSWNSEKLELVDRCIQDIVSEQVQMRPHAQAICSWDGDMTYQELDRYSSKLAHYLKRLGVGPESYVPMCFEKSKWHAVGMLAILKAGGACVPLDPSQPVARLGGIISETNARVLLSSFSQQNLLASLIETTVVVDMESLLSLPDHFFQINSEVQPHHPACVVYTSGSTGIPKGICIEHSAIASSAKSHGDGMHINQESRVLQFAAYMFDVSIQDTLTSLMRGACICIPSESQRVNDLPGAISLFKANWANLTPTVASLLQPDDLLGVHVLALGGERIRQDTVNKLGKHTNLMLIYGPAECSMTMSRNAKVKPNGDPANFGTALGSHMWIVDENDHHRLSPIGAVGEILIEGPILAKEYLSNKALTDKMFIVNPAWASTDSNRQRRMYKTGDLARYSTDGSVCFVRRKDNQVKLRGQRIELGEIEHRLWADDDVRHGIAMLLDKGGSKGKLVAVISLRHLEESNLDEGNLRIINNSQQRLEVSLLRSKLANQLPGYMVPQVWIVVNRFPLNPSGKLDRNRLRTWVQDMTDADVDNIVRSTNLQGLQSNQAVTPMEKRLQRIWSRVLNRPIELIPTSQGFIGSGGDSITAMQVVARARAEDVNISVQDILKSSSLSHLATRARSTKFLGIAVDEAFNVPFELSPIQKMHFQECPSGENHFNQSFLLEVKQSFSPQTLKQALLAIVERHSMLRARFLTDDENVWRQIVTTDVEGSFRYQVHQLPEGQTSIPAGVAETTQKSLDIRDGPIFAVDLFILSSGRNILYLVGHHLVIDFVSWRIILRDLEDLLESGKINAEKPLPFQVWAKLQADYSRENLDPESGVCPFSLEPANVKYWGMDQRPNLIGDVQFQSFELDNEVTEGLLVTCHSALRTDAMDVMIASVLQSFQATFTDRSTPALFTESHGREPWSSEIDLSSTVGWFTALSPLQVSLGVERDEDIVKTIALVKDARRSVPANGWPYFASRYLNDKGSIKFLHHHPAELIFNYVGLYQQFDREDAVFQPVPFEAENVTDRNHTMPRSALIDVHVTVEKGHMKFLFMFNKLMHHQSKLSHWVSTCKHLLTLAVERLQSSSLQFTTSDFPLLDLGDGGLNRITDQFTRANVKDLAEIEDIFPCSPIQAGMMLSQAVSDTYYQFCTIFCVKASTGSIDLQRLQLAWERVVERHAVLRTTFLESGSISGMYDQMTLKAPGANIPIIRADVDLTHKKQNSGIPIIVGQRPYTLAVYISSSGDVHLRLQMNHVIIDGASIAILIRDLCLAYDEMLPPGPGPNYRDYVEFLQRQSVENHLQYWSIYLAGVTPCHMPCLDASIGPSKDIYSQEIELNITLDNLNQFCKQLGTTISNVSRLAWGLVLQFYNGMTDVCFGYLTSGRDISIPGIEEAVGPYINMLICRVNLEQDVRITTALEILQNDFLGGLQHQHCSFAEIQHNLRLSGQQLFNSIISVQRAPDIQDSNTTLSIERLDGNDPTEYDLTVDVIIGKDDLFVRLDSWTSCLSTHQAKTVASTFRAIFESLISNPDQTLGKVQVLSSQDRSQIFSWNGTPPEVLETRIPNVIYHQTLAKPQAEAICAWDGNFTFHELEDLSDRLAIYLRNCGVTSESLVPLCFDKSAYTVITQLAVLKAGGACVSVDPKYPKNRLKTMLHDVEARVALVSSVHEGVLVGMVERILVVNSSLIHSLPSISNMLSLENSSSPRDTAFVVFTSGSTGKPKGIVLEHQAIATSSRAHGTACGVTPDTRALQFAAYTFDQHIEETFTTLMLGGCVCVLSEWERLNDLSGAMNRMRVNWADLTPTVASMLSPAEVPTMKTLCMGGEAIRKDVVDIWAQHVRVLNGYGPAECSICCAVSQHLGNPGIHPSNIGRGVGCLLWVTEIGNHDRLVPINSVGELLIEGPVLARGYLKNTDKTRLAFIKNPAWLPANSQEQNSRRMYKTGDLVRLLSDGTMEFVGRADNQIKLRGQRIELGDIEAVLLSVPCVSNSAVTLAQKGPCRNSLVAVITLSNISVPDYGSQNELEIADGDLVHLATHVSRIRTIMEENLPTHMIPAVLAVVKALPMLSSAKLDRSRIKKWTESISNEVYEQINNIYLPHNDLGTTLIPSNNSLGRSSLTSMEIKIQRAWAEVLGIDSAIIGLQSSFFEKGGDSIGSMRLVALLRRTGVWLTVADVFRCPRLHEMSGIAMTTDSKQVVSLPYKPYSLLSYGDSSTSFATLQHSSLNGDVEDILPATDYQSWAFSCGQLKSRGYNNYLLLRMRGTTDVVRLENACQLLVSHHPILRTAFAINSCRTIQVVTKASQVDFSVIEQSTESDYTEDITYSLIAQDMEEAVHLGATVTKFTVVKHALEKYTLIMRLSHAQYDGICFPIIIRDLQSAYDGRKLPESTPYPEFIRLSQLQSKSREAENFWTNLLDGSVMTNLVRHTSPSCTNLINKSRSRLISQAFLNGTDITFATIIKAAWSLVLSVVYDKPDVVFGHVISGRNVALNGIEGVVGPCMNIIPVRVQLDLYSTATELLRAVLDQQLASMPYENMGFRHIIERCTSWQKWTRFSSVVQHQNLDDSVEDFTMGGIKCKCDSFSPDHDAADVWIWSYPKNDGAILVDLTFSDKTMTEDMAQALLDMLCEAIGVLSNSSNSEIRIKNLTSEKLISWSPIRLGGSTCNQVLSMKNCSESVSALVYRAWKSTFGEGEIPYEDDSRTNYSPKSWALPLVENDKTTSSPFSATTETKEGASSTTSTEFSLNDSESDNSISKDNFSDRNENLKPSGDRRRRFSTGQDTRDKHDDVTPIGSSEELDHTLSPIYNLDTPLFDIKGDPIVVVEFADFYRRAGIMEMSVEHIIDHPTMRLQAQLLGGVL